MPSIGAKMILKDHGGTPLSVAEAFILGELSSTELERVGEVVTSLMLEAARIRLTALGRLTPEHIKEAATRKERAA